jgi:hypothetical protein
MRAIIFWLVVLPVTLAFILGFLANLFRTLAEQAAKDATSLTSTLGESFNPESSGEAVEEPRV